MARHHSGSGPCRPAIRLGAFCFQHFADIAHLIGGHRAESVPVEMDDTAVPLRLNQTLVRAPHEAAAGTWDDQLQAAKPRSARGQRKPDRAGRALLRAVHVMPGISR